MRRRKRKIGGDGVGKVVLTYSLFNVLGTIEEICLYDSLYRSSNSWTALKAVTSNLSCDSLCRSSNNCKALTAITVFTARGPKAELI